MAAPTSKTITPEQEAEVKRLLDQERSGGPQRVTVSTNLDGAQAPEPPSRSTMAAPLIAQQLGPGQGGERAAGDENEGGGENEASEPGAESMLDDDQQMAVARQLREQRVQQTQTAPATGEQRDSLTGGVVESTEETTSALPPKKQIGLISGASMLGLCITKDIIDFFDLGLTGTITNFFVIVAIFLIMIMQGQSVKEFINKRKYIIASGAALEFIPIISIVPIWSLSMLWILLESRRQAKVSIGEASQTGKSAAQRFSKSKALPTGK